MPKLSHLICACAGVWLAAGNAPALPANQNIIIELPTSPVKSTPYYAVQLPMALYPLSANSRLSDLKIRNTKGDFLNYAWLDSTKETLKIESHTLPFFPISAVGKDTEQSKEVVALNILRLSDGSLIAQNKLKPTGTTTTPVRTWIIDASKLNPNARLVQARVRIDKNFQGIAPLKIEASEDFKNWYSLGSVEQLVQLKHQGEQIQKLSLDLGYCKAKYLRLSLQVGSQLSSQKSSQLSSQLSSQTSSEQAQASPQILGIAIDTQEQELVTPKMQWTTPIQAHHCDTNSCEYQVPANTLVDSLRLHLQEKNTLAKVQFFGELPPSEKPSTSHQHFRNPLYVLRHQKQVSTTPATQDIFLGDVNAYRLELPAGEISTEDLSLGGYVLNKIRLQIPAGVKSLGTQAPTISLGSLSRHLAFLSRGDTPYRIEFSASTREGAALDIDTLMPKHHLHDTFLDFAEVRIPTSNTKQNVASSAPNKASVLNKSESTKNPYWLWTALLAALAILGAMVWSLLRNIDKENK